MDRVSIKINKDTEGKTIKEFLKNNNIGRPTIEKIRTNKLSYINNNHQNLEYVLKNDDILSLEINENIDFVCTEGMLDILYEDDYLLIVNKPSGLLIHNDNKEKEGALANIVAYYYKMHNINRNVRYIHRIDKDTTGIVVFAKDYFTEACLLKDMQNNKIDKYYIAFVEGNMKNYGKIDLNIGTDRHINGKMCVAKNGKEAHTEYKTLKHYKDYSKVSFKLITGRTHQIRVHTSYIGHPILGDVLYGGNMIHIKRVALHFENIRFTHPILNSIIDIHSPLPGDMKELDYD